MRKVKIEPRDVEIFTRQELFNEFFLVINGDPYDFRDLTRPQNGKEEDYILRKSDNKKFTLADYQPRDCFQTGDVAIMEYKE